RPPPPPLFPYTTLFRSAIERRSANPRAKRSAVLEVARTARKNDLPSALREPPGKLLPRLRRPLLHRVHVATRPGMEHDEGLARRSEEHTSELQSRENLV